MNDWTHFFQIERGRFDHPMWVWRHRDCPAGIGLL